MKTMFVLLIFLSCSQSFAFELQGLLGYDLNLMSGKPTNTVGTGAGVTYGFLGRVDLGPGQIESGFLYAPTSITTNNAFFDSKSSASFWIIPVLYRFQLLPPFLSIAVGPDFAYAGNTTTVINGLVLANNNNFLNHPGAEVSAEASQDIGENLSVFFDLRYRQGLSDAIRFSNQGTKFNFLLMALGLQKRLE